MKLLERAGIDYHTFVYSHSTYGRAQFQHDLIDGLVAHCATSGAPGLGDRRRASKRRSPRRIPTSASEGSCRLRRSARTGWPCPSLQHGFTDVALGITRSTDEHNLVWDKTGEEINYLWGMSADAERLLHDYVRRELVFDLRMFHLLRPIYDVNVFSLLRRDPAAVPATHSCAQLKPWCGRCAKCLYVWMSYVLGSRPKQWPRVDRNLFSIPQNRTLLRKMLGLESYKPTDCVGTVSEARLAFAMCRAKGVHGTIADDIDLAEFLAEADATLDRYAPAAPAGPTYPERLVAPMAAAFQANSEVTKAIALEVLSPRNDRARPTVALVSGFGTHGWANDGAPSTRKTISSM